MKRRADFFEFAGLKDKPGIGIELGVASGGFLRLASIYTFMRLWGVDSWEGERGVIEYRNALSLLDPGRVSLVRLQEVQAECLFGPNNFDFIYVDLFAHNALDLNVLDRWYPKLKPDGILAGDDYCRKDFPALCDAVDAFAAKHNKYVAVFEYEPEPNDVYSQHPSWVLFDMPF